MALEPDWIPGNLGQSRQQGRGCEGGKTERGRRGLQGCVRPAAQELGYLVALATALRARRAPSAAERGARGLAGAPRCLQLFSGAGEEPRVCAPAIAPGPAPALSLAALAPPRPAARRRHPWT